MANQRRIENFPNVLVVEGYSDLLFYAEALEYLDKLDEVFIKEFNGASALITQLELFLSPDRLAQHKAIGVIADADSNAIQRSAAIAQVLLKATTQHVSHGDWSSGAPRIGYFVVPDGNSPGEVETLAWEAWINDPNNSQMQQCIDSYLACMQSIGHAAKSPDKGRIGALPAVRNDEDPRLGPGARANVFSFDRPEYGPLLDFLRRM